MHLHTHTLSRTQYRDTHMHLHTNAWHPGLQWLSTRSEHRRPTMTGGAPRPPPGIASGVALTNEQRGVSGDVWKTLGVRTPSQHKYPPNVQQPVTSVLRLGGGGSLGKWAKIKPAGSWDQKSHFFPLLVLCAGNFGQF